MRLNPLSLCISLSINNVPVDEAAYHIDCNARQLPTQPHQREWWDESLTQDDYEKLMTAQSKRMRRAARNKRNNEQVTYDSIQQQIDANHVSIDS